LPLIRKGHRKDLEIEDIELSLEEDDARSVVDELAIAFSSEGRRKSNGHLLSALRHIHGHKFAWLGILQFLDSALRNIQGIILGHCSFLCFRKWGRDCLEWRTPSHVNSWFFQSARHLCCRSFGHEDENFNIKFSLQESKL